MAQLKALLGWEADKMASLYTKSAERRKLAKQFIDKFGNQNKLKTSLP